MIQHAASPPTFAHVNSHLIAKEPLEIFKMIITPEFIKSVVEFTNIYAVQKGCDFRTTSDELYWFFLLSGYHCSSTEDSYWSTAADMNCPIVPKTTSKERFAKIKRFLHFVDNTQLLISHDKYAKIRPFYDNLNKLFVQFRVCTEHLSIDKSGILLQKTFRVNVYSWKASTLATKYGHFAALMAIHFSFNCMGVPLIKLMNL